MLNSAALALKIAARWMTGLWLVLAATGCGGGAHVLSPAPAVTPAEAAAVAAAPASPLAVLTPRATSAGTAPFTATPTLTAQPSRTATAQPTVPPTATATAALTATATATASLTPTSTATPAPSATPTSGPTPDGQARTLRVPILMYHYTSAPPADADVYRRDLSVSPEQLESHLRYLVEAEYNVITLDDLLYALAQGRRLPDRPVILTFDDGHEDNYVTAFPLLQKYGMVGHFFIITDFVNQERPGYMTWPQIEEMSAAGQHFGSHSRDHPNLAGQPLEYLVWQALGGLESIQEHLGYHPRWITYPSGSYDQQVIAVYRSAHYWGGLTTRQGATHTLEDVFELRRVRVRGSHTAADLAVLLQLDW